MPQIEHAVYAEHSDANKPMGKGFNVRVFNRREVQEAHSIQLEDGTGVVRLEPGLYHVSASSLVTYGDPTWPDPSVVSTRERPYGGYCRLRYAGDVDCPNEQAIAVGTVGNANMLPSLVETYLRVDQPVSIVLEHQVGGRVDDIYLQVNARNSTWHVFARMAIRRL